MNLLTASESALALAQPDSREPAIHLEAVSVRYRVPHERIGTFKEYAIRRLQRRVSHDEF